MLKRVAVQCAKWAMGVVLGLTSSMVAADDDVPIVSPVDELQVLDPRVDSEGKPRAIARDSGDGTIQVEIPPTIIVHRYYYTGERSFQGPLLVGGPTIVVVNHPQTGEQMNLQVQMLPGAPRIEYSKHHIVYDFGRRKVKIHFGLKLPLHDVPTPEVSYHDAHPNSKRVAVTRERCKLHQQVCDASKIVHGATVSVVNVLPFGTWITEPLQDKCENGRPGSAPSELTEGLDETIRTVR